MSEKGNKKEKAQPSIEESPEDISTSQADLQKSSPSGSPCICEGKRDIMCQIHGG
jgi:hypothetical protein